MRKQLTMISVFVLVLLLPMQAFAHPGRTDANGGHYDRSTGEYHYHHGFPAHDHYDIDGDGIIDCPYDFVDKTGENSGSRYSSGNSQVSDSKPVSEKKETDKSGMAVQDMKEEGRDKEMRSLSVTIAILVLLLAAMIILAIRFGLKIKSYEELLERKNSELARLKNSEHKLQIEHSSDEKIISELRSELNSEKEKSQNCQNALRRSSESLSEGLRIASKKLMEKSERVRSAEEKCGRLSSQYNSLLTLIQRNNKEIQLGAYSINNPISTDAVEQLDLKIRVPNDVYFNEFGIPILLDPLQEPLKSFPYGGYTVFSNASSDVYHANDHCSGYNLAPEHIFKMLEKRKRPCKRCGGSRVTCQTIPQWYLDVQEIRKGNNEN